MKSSGPSLAVGWETRYGKLLLEGASTMSSRIAKAASTSCVCLAVLERHNFCLTHRSLDDLANAERQRLALTLLPPPKTSKGCKHTKHFAVPLPAHSSQPHTTGATYPSPTFTSHAACVKFLSHLSPITQTPHNRHHHHKQKEARKGRRLPPPSCLIPLDSIAVLW